MKRFALVLLTGACVAFAAPPLAAFAGEAGQAGLNLQDADIRAFIQDVARATGRTFVIDPRVQGRVTVTSGDNLSRTELFEILLSTLRANRLVAIPTGSGGYRIAPEEGAAREPSALGDSAGPGFVTQVFRLRSIDAQSAAVIVNPLIGSQGAALPARRGNLLVVADYADNLARIRSLIAQIDQDRSVSQTVTLRAVPAAEMAAVVNELLAGPTGDPSGRNGLISVVIAPSSNSLVLRGDPVTLNSVIATIADLDKRAEQSGDVRVVHLQHAAADQVAAVLQQIVGQQVTASAAPPSTTRPMRTSLGGSAPATGTATATASTPAISASNPLAGPAISGVARANIARFPGANALVISADPDTQRTLGEVIRQLDVRREQVLVEAIVVEISDETANRLGVQFAVGGRDGNPFFATSYPSADPNLLALGAAAAAREQGLSGAAQEALQQSALSSILRAGGLLAGGAGRSGDVVFGSVLNAIKSDTKSNLLSTPSVMTLDNEQATILVGQEVPVTTGEVLGDSNANPFRTIQRQNVGVQLEVRPQINAGGAITLYLRQEVSSVAGPVSASVGELVLNKREIETTVNVDDGNIVVLGGLLDTNRRTSTERVPVLGDIPGLGNLFRSTSREGTKTNLMVFIRPTIVRTAAAAKAVTAPRYDYIRRQQSDEGADLDAMLRDYMRTAPPAAAPSP